MNEAIFVEANVIAVHRTDGTVVPERVIIDDIIYPVDKVLRVTPISTTKRGGDGLRYDAVIDGKPNVLYLEDASSYTTVRRWFVVER